MNTGFQRNSVRPVVSASETGAPSARTVPAKWLKCPGHTIGDKVEAAGRRGDLFKKRRRLMKEWAVFCANPGIRKGSVISMNAARPYRYPLEYHCD